MDPNEVDSVTGHPTLLAGGTCGENRFVSVDNFLEFYITPGCEIEIEPRDAIVGSVRMEWTLAEFWDDGGSSAFIHRVASALNIHASRIFTIQVYEGSVCI